MRAIERAEYLSHARTARYRARVSRSREIVAEFLERVRNPYIAYSTGKDSTCVAALVWEQAPDVQGVYFDAQCAFPESEELLDRMGQRVLRWPCEPFLDTLERVGGPTAEGCERETMRSTVYRPLKSLLAAHHYDGFVMGLRSEESTYRAMMARHYGPLFWQKRDEIWECNPILEWSWRDVWAFIIANNLDYNEAYDYMDEMPLRKRRISYWAGETSHTHGRWAWLRRRYPDLWAQYVARFPEVTQYT